MRVQQLKRADRKQTARYEGKTSSIEVNTVLRGTVLALNQQLLRAHRRIQEYVETGLAHRKLYGGKLVAALDRQHPRDCSTHAASSNQEGESERFFSVVITWLHTIGRRMSCSIKAARALTLFKTNWSITRAAELTNSSSRESS